MSGDVVPVQASSPRRSTLDLPVLLILGAVLAAYGRVLGLPFIQDDWTLLLRFQTMSWNELLTILTSVRGVLFYRPLSFSYLFGMHEVFGLYPLPYHAAALLIHAANAVLVLLILRRVGRDQLMATCGALLYVLAVPVHMETLMWTVGINDLGAAFFFLLAILLFVRNRSLGSAAAYLLSCLFKESGIVLPAILLAYQVLGLHPVRGRRLPDLARALGPHLVVLLLISIIRLLGVSPTGLPYTHPYAMRLLGPHVAENLLTYVLWQAQSIFPFELPAQGVLGTQVLPGLVLFAFVLGLLRFLWDRPRETTARLGFYLLWMLLPLLVVVFLPNHVFRYYLVYSTPPFIAACLLLASHAAGRGGRRGASARRWLLVGTSVSAFVALCSSQVVLTEGVEQSTFALGTNFLVRRAAYVDLVQDGLQRLLPEVPPQSVLFLGEVDIWAFAKDAGPRVWYHQPDLAVYPLDSMRRDADGLFVESPFETQEENYLGASSARKRIDSSRVFAFEARFLDGRLELAPVDLSRIPMTPDSNTGWPSFFHASSGGEAAYEVNSRGVRSKIGAGNQPPGG